MGKFPRRHDASLVMGCVDKEHISLELLSQRNHAERCPSPSAVVIPLGNITPGHLRADSAEWGFTASTVSTPGIGVVGGHVPFQAPHGAE